MTQVGNAIKKNIWLALLVFILIGIIAGLYFWLSQSDVLAVEDIIIDGNRSVATEEIMEKTGPWMRGRSLIQLSFDDAVRPLRDIPYIESVELERDFPHTMIIHVREYRPFVTLAASEGRYLILSADGNTLASLPAPPPDMTLLITKEPCAAEAGRQVDCPDVITGYEFLNNIPTNFNQDIAEVRVADADVTIRTRSGIDVHFGTLEDYGLKFEVMRQLMARTVAAGTTVTIDVSVVERPITKDGNSSTTSATTATTQATGE